MPRGNPKLDERMRRQGFLPIPEAANLACVSASTMYRWIDEGEVEAKDVGTRVYVDRKSVVRRSGVEDAEES